MSQCDNTKPSTPNALSLDVERQLLGVKIEHYLYISGMHTASESTHRSGNTTRIWCARACSVQSHAWIQCSNFYANDMSLDAERQRVRCAWAFTGKDTFA